MRKIYRSLAVFTLVLLLLWLSLPQIFRYGLVNWLEGAGYTVELEHLSISLGKGLLGLESFVLTGPDNTRANIGLLQIDIQWLPLLSSKFIIEELQLKDIGLGMGFDGQQLSLAGVPLSRLLQGSTEKTEISNDHLSHDIEQEQHTQLQINNIQIKDIEACLHRKTLLHSVNQCIRFDELVMSEQLTIDVTPELRFTHNGSMRLQGLAARDVFDQFHIAGIGAVTVSDWEWRSGGGRLGTLGFESLTFLERDDSYVYHSDTANHAGAEAIVARGVDFNAAENLLSVNDVQIKGVEGFVHKDKHVRLPLLRRIDQLLLLTGLENQQSLIQTEDHSGHLEQELPGIDLVIETIRIEQGRLAVLDESVNPPVSIALDDIRVELGAINNREGEAISVQLGFRQGVGGSVLAEGSVELTEQNYNVNFELLVASLDLVPLSAYIETAIGYRVQRGQLNAELDVDIKGEDLDIGSRLRFHKFYLKPLKPEQTESQADSVMLPFNTALNLLRDGDDQILLKLPVTGKISAPDFSLAHIFGVVGRKALTEAVINYYSPFGAVRLVGAIGKSMTRLRFESLSFDPGRAELSEKSHSQLLKVLDLFKDKPGLTLSFCATASGGDWLALGKLKQWPEGKLKLSAEQQKQLTELALQRAKAVQVFLLDKGVKSEQVILCNPEINLENRQQADMTVGI